MIELPEAITIGRQIEQALRGKVVTDVLAPTYLHKFTFFNEPTAAYRSMLLGRTMQSASGKGIFVDMLFDDDIHLCIHDGINARYSRAGEPVPSKYQMLITFDDESFVSFSTSMYGGIYVFHNNFDNKYYKLSLASLSPLSAMYDKQVFDNLIEAEKKNISLKALLASEQRIPGVGNGVLQDILFNAELLPKRKIFTLDDDDKSRLFSSLKTTLVSMTNNGGRNTETDFMGKRGGYETILSKLTYQNPCHRCGGVIKKEAYMGGAVYYCSDCQK